MPELKWIDGPLEEMKAGMLASDGSDIMLVGDVNEVGGHCDHCLDIREKNVIKWCWLITPERLKEAKRARKGRKRGKEGARIR